MNVHNILYSVGNMHVHGPAVANSTVRSRVYRIIVSARTDIVLHTIHNTVRREAK